MRLHLACLLLLLLFSPASPAAAHVEVPRTDLAAIAAGADLVVRGRVVQVVADRGSRGPRWVSIVAERVLAGGGEEMAALTFRAPMEHGPGWLVGEHALFFLAQLEEGGWYGAALAVECPRAASPSGADLEERFLRAVAPGEEPSATAEGLAEAEGALSVAGLVAGAATFLGLAGLGRWRRRRLPGRV